MQVPSVVRACLAALLPLLLLHPPQARAGQLKGVVLLKPAFSLPPDSILDVQLLEVARADAPGALIGRSRSGPVGRSPYPVTITMVDAAIQPQGRYLLRATVRDGERLLFTSTTAVPWQPAHRLPLRLVLEAVDGGPLRGYPWLRAPAASVPVREDAPRKEQQFSLDPLTTALRGSGDCNRFSGSYDLQGDRLRLLPAIKTPMDCEPSVIADEEAFLAALARVRRWRLDDQGRLELLADSGDLLLRMEPRPH